MAEAKDCPRCGLVNPPEARRCDCGYDFVERRFLGSLSRSPRRVRPDIGSSLLLGFVLIPAGAVVGACVGIPVRVWLAGPGPDGCGLWVLPVMMDGLTTGSLVGGLTGAAATVFVAPRRR
jgi:hypothetical protein